jgi:class 3 adenylate cyclase
MALDMMKAMDDFNAHHGYKLKIRIGLNSGTVVAGVIGKRKFVYDLWGDVVNTASRMESHGKSGRIQITDATRSYLSDLFMLEPRGMIAVKGKGATHTWFLTGRSSSQLDLLSHDTGTFNACDNK